MAITTEQDQVRLAKLEALRASGREAYPVSVPRTDELAQVRARHIGLAASSTTGDVVSVTGRVIANRGSGKIAFAVLREGEEVLQVMLDQGTSGQALLDWKAFVDLGDAVSVTGEVVTSRSGELSVLATSWVMAAKSLHPGVGAEAPSDPELLRVQRHLALLTSEDSRARLRARSNALRALRTTLWGEGFDEVDTPLLHKVHGGAARPFATHAEALERDLTLRIAPELHLKRLLAGGCERIFEVGSNFRNEGIDSTHSPEFVMLEAYQSWSDYSGMAELFERLVRAAAVAVNSSTEVSIKGRVVDLAAPWRRATLHELVSEALGSQVTSSSTLGQFRTLAASVGSSITSGDAGRAAVELFEELVEGTLVEPTFVLDWPVEVRPLTRRHRSDPRLTESWDLVVGGVELGTAYSELTDPVEQRARLVEQAARQAGGDVEAMGLDEEFLTALEHGVVPTGGLGLGVDRLLMLLTSTASLRDTITFPMAR
jgi:lysyl-tRNA synthetase class 2